MIERKGFLTAPLCSLRVRGASSEVRPDVASRVKTKENLKQISAQLSHRECHRNCHVKRRVNQRVVHRKFVCCSSFYFFFPGNRKLPSPHLCVQQSTSCLYGELISHTFHDPRLTKYYRRQGWDEPTKDVDMNLRTLCFPCVTCLDSLAECGTHGWTDGWLNALKPSTVTRTWLH